MYKVILHDHSDSISAEGQVLLDTSSGDNPGLTQAVVESKLNEAGSFSYSIVPTHPLYNMTSPLKTYVSVREDTTESNTEIFYGRILSVQINPLTKIKAVTCEGALAFLLDAELPIDTEDRKMTAENYFKYCVNQFNSAISNDAWRRLRIGNIDVDDKTDEHTYKNSSYTQIQSVMKNQLLNMHDGFFRIRRDGSTGYHYIDWVKQVGRRDPQQIAIMYNVVDQTNTESGEDIFSVMRPIGNNNDVKLNEDDGLINVSNSMVTDYGKIIRTVTFDADDAATLKTKARAYINKIKNRLTITNDISFVDFRYLFDDSTVTVHVGDVFTNIQGYENTNMTAESVTRNLLDAGKDKLSLKTDKELMKSAYSSGANGGSATGIGSSRKLSAASSSAAKEYKFYHETEKTAMIEVSEKVTSLKVDLNTINSDWVAFKGSAFYVNRDHIDSVCGEYIVSEEEEGKKKLIIKNGTAIYQRYDSVTVGLYDERNLTAGIIVGKVNGDSTVQISADRIYLNGETIANRIKATDANFTNLVSGSTKASIINVGALNGDTVTGGTVYATTQLSIGSGTGSGSGSLFYRGEQFYRQGLLLGNLGSIVEAYFLGNGSKSVSLDHYHKIVATEGTGADAGKIILTLSEPVATSDTTNSTTNFNIAATTTYKNGVIAAKNSVKVKPFTANPVTGPGSLPDHRTFTYTTDASTPASDAKQEDTWWLAGGTSWTDNKTTVVMHYNTETGTPYAQLEVDASDLVSDATTAGINTGKASVTLTDPTWNPVQSSSYPTSNTVTVRTSGRAHGTVQEAKATSSVYMVNGTTWSNNKLKVFLHLGSEGGTVLAATEVDASDLVSDATTAGINTGKASVGLNDLTWTPTGATLPTSQEITARTTGRTTSTLQEIKKTLSLSLAKGTTWSADNKLTVTLKAGSGLTPIAATEVDATELVTNATYAGKASVGLSNVTWQYDPVYILNYNRLTIKTNGRTDSTGARDELTVRETLYLVQGEWDSNDMVDVTLRRGTSSGDAYARITVNASDLTFNAERRGRAAVNISDFWWSDPPSTGLPSSRTIYIQTTGRTDTSGATANITKDLTLKLVQGSTWSDDYKLTVTLKSGSNTSYEETTVDASGIVSEAETAARLAGKKSVTLQDPVWTDPPTNGNLGTSCNIRVKTSGRTGTGIENLEKNVGMSLSSSGLTVYMKWGKTQVGKITCSPSITLPTSVSTSSTATTGVDKEYSASRSANYIYFTVTAGGTSKKIQIHLLNA